MMRFTVTGGRLRGTDPCYEPPAGEGLAAEFPALDGEWVAETEASDEGSWGQRVSRLTVRSAPRVLARVVEHEVAVDSGQLGAFSADRYVAEHDSRLEEGSFYSDACAATEDRAGVVRGFGVASSSGFGDGVYTARVYLDPDGLAFLVDVEFIGEEDEEEDEEDEDEEDYDHDAE